MTIFKAIRMIALSSTLSVLATAAFAANNCPSLKGEFTCGNGEDFASVAVREEAKGAHTLYSVDYGIGQLTVIPDGRTQTVNQLAGLEEVGSFTYNGTCAGSTIKFTGVDKDGPITGTLTRGKNRIVINVNFGKEVKPMKIECTPNEAGPRPSN